MIRKMRGRKATGEAVEFQMEDVGLAAGAYETRFTGDVEVGSRVPATDVEAAQSGAAHRQDRDIAALVLSGLMPSSIQAKSDGQWQGLLWSSHPPSAEMILAGVRVMERLSTVVPSDLVGHIWAAMEKARTGT